MRIFASSLVLCALVGALRRIAEQKAAFEPLVAKETSPTAGKSESRQP